MNIYKFHSNPDELIGHTSRNFYFGDEAEKLILQGKEVTKNVVGTLYLSGTAITALPDNLTVHEDLYLNGTPITALPDNLKVGGNLWINSTPNLDTNNLPSSLVVKGEIMY